MSWKSLSASRFEVVGISIFLGEFVDDLNYFRVGCLSFDLVAAMHDGAVVSVEQFANALVGSTHGAEDVKDAHPPHASALGSSGWCE